MSSVSACAALARRAAVIPLPVDQRQAHGKFLRHAHHRVVDRLVAVRMILAHHVADDARRLAIALVPVEAVLVHRIQDAAMHRLQSVARVGESATDDHAHGVIEVRALQLGFDGDGRDGAAVFGPFGRAGRVVRVAQIPVLEMPFPAGMPQCGISSICQAILRAKCIHFAKLLLCTLGDGFWPSGAWA